MKYFLLVSMALLTLNAKSQTYPFVDAFQAYQTGYPLNTQNGYNSNMEIYDFGIGGSHALVAYMNGSSLKSTLTPLIGPFTAITQLRISYKIIDHNASPQSAYTLTSTDSVNFYVMAGPSAILIGSINSSNQVLNNAYQKLVLNSDPGAAGLSSKFKINVVNTNSANNFAVDFDSLIIADAAGVPFTVTPVVTNVSCNGISNGVVDLNISSTFPPFTYAWSNGEIAPSLIGFPAGDYSVTVTDATSTTASAAMTITEPPALIATVSHTNASSVTATDGSITFDATGGTPSLKYSVDSGLNYFPANVFNNLGVDCYSPFVKDSNQCIISLDTVCVIFTPTTTNTNNIQSLNFMLYPNPANDYIYIDTKNKNQFAEVINTLGEVVLRKEINTSETAIDLSGLSFGSYFLRLSSDKNSFVRYFSIQRE